MTRNSPIKSASRFLSIGTLVFVGTAGAAAAADPFDGSYTLSGASARAIAYNQDSCKWAYGDIYASEAWMPAGGSIALPGGYAYLEGGDRCTGQAWFAVATQAGLFSADSHGASYEVSLDLTQCILGPALPANQGPGLAALPGAPSCAAPIQALLTVTWDKDGPTDRGTTQYSLSDVTPLGSIEQSFDAVGKERIALVQAQILFDNQTFGMPMDGDSRFGSFKSGTLHIVRSAPEIVVEPVP